MVNHESMASELVAAVPAMAPTTDGPASVSIIGLYTEVQKIITAIRAKDARAAMEAAYNILGIILGKNGSGGDSISFSPRDVALAGINLELIKSVLKRLIPILLDELTKQ